MDTLDRIKERLDRLMALAAVQLVLTLLLLLRVFGAV